MRGIGGLEKLLIYLQPSETLIRDRQVSAVGQRLGGHAQMPVAKQGAKQVSLIFRDPLRVVFISVRRLPPPIDEDQLDSRLKVTSLLLNYLVAPLIVDEETVFRRCAQNGVLGFDDESLFCPLGEDRRNR